MIRDMLRTLASGIVTWVLVAVGTYHIAIYLSPARTADGHPVMPIGHVVLAAFAATIASLVVMVAFWLGMKRRRERQIEEIAAGRSTSNR